MVIERHIGKAGFTLVELLVVIGIIGVLAGVLLASFGGATESARAAKCLANMRSLAVACQSYGMANGTYPLAASLEYSWIDESEGIRNMKERFGERKGWISWASSGAYDGVQKPTSSRASTGWFLSSYTTDEAAAMHCMTNGALWKFVSGNRDVFLCPSHVRVAKNVHKAPHWSYMMNGYFGGDVAREGATFDETDRGVGYSGLKRADRRLLFAELPFADGLDESIGASDTVFQYNGMADVGGTPDELYFNHSSGNNRFAHVVYADAHVDKLMLPRNASVDGKKLGQWLCEGNDVSFNGREYEKLD